MNLVACGRPAVGHQILHIPHGYHEIQVVLIRQAHPPLSGLSRRGSSRPGDSPGKGEATIDNLDESMTPMKEEKKSKGSFARVIAMTKADWKFALAGSVGSIGAGCLNPVYELLLAEVLSVFYSTNYHHLKVEVSKYALGLVALGAASPFIYTLQHYSLGIMGERLVKRVRERMFATILGNELGWYDDDENNSSQIAARLAC